MTASPYCVVPLPAWADPYRDLIAEIVADRPDRTLPMDDMPGHGPTQWGFRGRKAADLRRAYEVAYSAMLDTLPPFGTSDRAARREAIIRWSKLCNSDAVIQRALDASEQDFADEQFVPVTRIPPRDGYDLGVVL